MKLEPISRTLILSGRVVAIYPWHESLIAGDTIALGHWAGKAVERKLLVYDGLTLAWHGLDGLANLVLRKVLLCGRQLRELLVLPVSHGVYISKLEFIP
ncbi:hypothetical protein TELCIR_03939 [Teladorsagia circumcincta]|uniref:Uncharacterized protein n=1 Tax=Teladorsagia circumcincta TaxID=45464 RepID=A0A2G9UV20_TELCI|nr:hypothetical protein TELCIR_03939 [Teladorsagia circumcincta]